MRDSGAGLISLPISVEGRGDSTEHICAKRDPDAIGRLKLNRIHWPQTDSRNLYW